MIHVTAHDGDLVTGLFEISNKLTVFISGKDVNGLTVAFGGKKITKLTFGLKATN